MAFEFNDANFEQALSQKELAIVDFWAVWCGPCRAIAPIITDIATELKDSVLVGKLDVDHNPETAMKYNVRSIPTILFFKNGELIGKQVGASTKDKLLENFNNALAQKQTV